MRKQAKQIPEAQRHILREKLLQEVKEKCGGLEQEQIIVMLHDAGLSIVESAWVLCRAYDQPLAEVKDIVTAHPIWEEIVKANEPLHDALEKAMRRSDGMRKKRGVGDPR